MRGYKGTISGNVFKTQWKRQQKDKLQDVPNQAQQEENNMDAQKRKGQDAAVA